MTERSPNVASGLSSSTPPTASVLTRGGCDLGSHGPGPTVHESARGRRGATHRRHRPRLLCLHARRRRRPDAVHRRCRVARDGGSDERRAGPDRAAPWRRPVSPHHTLDARSFASALPTKQDRTNPRVKYVSNIGKLTARLTKLRGSQAGQPVRPWLLAPRRRTLESGSEASGTRVGTRRPSNRAPAASSARDAAAAYPSGRRGFPVAMAERAAVGSDSTVSRWACRSGGLSLVPGRAAIAAPGDATAGARVSSTSDRESVCGDLSCPSHDPAERQGGRLKSGVPHKPAHGSRYPDPKEDSHSNNQITQQSSQCEISSALRANKTAMRQPR